jgi:hypothetical protein
MKRVTLLIFIGVFVYCAASLGQEIYQWVDEKGTVHFTDDVSKIPEKYQDQVTKKNTPPEPAPSPSIKLDQDRVPPGPDTEKKDLLGRGEEWWREKAMEWKQKLTKAQEDFNATQTALKNKDKELEDAKLKPKSYQRRLLDEIKVLEEKANEQKKQVEEATNMLEKVLPKQAEEYRADPSWVRIE